MWHLLDLVSRGHQYYLNGAMHDPDKLPGFIDKMHERFGTLIAPSTRAKRKKRCVPTAHLVLYQDADSTWLWWVLFAGDVSAIKKRCAEYREASRDAGSKGGRLQFRDEYVLRQRQRPRTDGGGRTWTWFMAKPVVNAVERELVSLSSSHGWRSQRTDDLERAVERLRNRPMFNGVRLQASHALTRAKRTWYKTHASGERYPEILDAPLPAFVGRMRLFN